MTIEASQRYRKPKSLTGTCIETTEEMAGVDSGWLTARCRMDFKRNAHIYATLKIL